MMSNPRRPVDTNPIEAAATRIRMWLVQHDRYNGSTFELDEVLVHEIQRAVDELGLKSQVKKP